MGSPARRLRMPRMLGPLSRALKPVWWEANFSVRQRTRAPAELTSCDSGAGKCV